LFCSSSCSSCACACSYPCSCSSLLSIPALVGFRNVQVLLRADVQPTDVIVKELSEKLRLEETAIKKENKKNETEVEVVNIEDVELQEKQSEEEVNSTEKGKKETKVSSLNFSFLLPLSFCISLTSSLPFFLLTFSVVKELLPGNSQDYGWIKATMIRVKLLHQFLWKQLKEEHPTVKSPTFEWFPILEK
jgi:hypothetical protein